MAKLRKWVAYRKIERSYCRYAKKVRKKAFVKSRPGKKVIKFDMGDLKGGADQFPLLLQLTSKDAAQVRANAIEAARQTSLRKLEEKLGRQGFHFKILMVPHHTIRENPLAAGAGADRLSTGMKHSFGKTIGTAARVEKGKVVMELALPAKEENFGREILARASKKLPIRTTVVGVTRKAKELTKEQLEAIAIEKEKIAKQEAERRAKQEAEAAAKEAKKE